MSRKKYPRYKDFSEIGRRIRKIRGDLSQTAFGNIFRVKQNTVSRWEKGLVLSDKDTLRKIADYGGVTVEWLLRGDQPPAPKLLENSLEVYGVRHAPPLDGALLAEILTEIKKFMAEKRVKLSPEREARLVALVYDHCMENNVKPDRTVVDRFLWITKVE